MTQVRLQTTIARLVFRVVAKLKRVSYAAWFRLKTTHGGDRAEGGTMASAHDVAAYILQLEGCMTAMKLQKLVYYSQAWSLAWDNEPLFKEKVQAWAHGPVVYELYQSHQGKYRVELSDFPTGNPANLDSNQRETINCVLEPYGGMTAAQLSELTHAEEPWIRARKNARDGAPSSTEITRASMRSYYSSLEESGEGVESVADLNFPAWAR